jgi:hypothetical protein
MEPIAATCTLLQSDNSMFWGYYAPLIRKMQRSIEQLDQLKYCSPLKDALLFGIEKR